MPKPITKTNRSSKIVKPSQRRNDIEYERDEASYGNRYDPTQYGTAQAASSRKSKPGVVDVLTNLVTGGMTRDERVSAAERTRAATSYQDEQDALLAAAKARRQEEETESFKKRRAEQKRLDELGKEAQKAYKPHEEQERFAEDARRYSAERKAAAEREAAAETNPGGRNVRGETRAEEKAPEFFPTSPEPLPSEKPKGGWETFAGDDDWEEGVDEQLETDELGEEAPQGTTGGGFDPYPTSDEPLPSETMQASTSSETDYAAMRAEYDDLLQKRSELYTLIESTGVYGEDYDDADIARLAEMDARLKELYDVVGSRVGNVFAGASGQYLSGMANAGGTAAIAAGEIGSQYGNAATWAGLATDPLSSEAIGYGTEAEQQAWAEEMQKAKDFGASLEAAADSLGEKAAGDLAAAKAGLGTFGSAGVDIATNVIQMGYDAALGKLPGFGSLGAMFFRTFGSSAQEARQGGADLWEQISYGAVKGGIEVATEKMFDGVAGIYGKGDFDEFAEGLIQHLASSDTGRTILRVIEKGVEEGGEEVVSDIFGPLAETIINDETLYSLFFDKDGHFLKGSYALNGQEVAYDFLIGAFIGSMGGATGVATGQDAKANEELRESDEAKARVNEQMEGVMDALAGKPPIRQAPGMEIGQETDAGTGGRPVDEILAEAAKPKTEEERKATGEERAEEKAPGAPQQQEEAPQEGTAPEEEQPAEEKAPAEEQPASDELGQKQKSREPQTPEEILADQAARKGEEERRTGEGRAEEQAPEAPAELPEKAKGPDQILAEEASGKGDTTKGPSEAAESKEGSDHESVPPGARKAIEEAPEKLNSNASIPERVQALKGELKGLKPFTREYESAEHDIHNYYWQLVSGAKEHLDAIKQFAKNGSAEVAFYDSAEDAEAQYGETIKALRECNLPPLKELRQKARWVEERIEWAQRQLEKIYQAAESEGRGALNRQESADADYYEEAQVRFKNEAEELDEVCDFLEAHYAEVYSPVQKAPQSDKIDATIKEGGNSDAEGRKESGRPELESHPARRGGDKGKVRENDNRGTHDINRENTRRDTESSPEAEKRKEVKDRHARGRSEAISQLPSGATVLDINNLPKQYGWVKTVVEKVKLEAPDCEIVVAKHAGDIAYYHRGTGTIVVDPEKTHQWAKDATNESGIEQTEENAIMHERVHYWFDESDYTASEIVKYLKSDFAKDRDALVALNAAYEAHRQKYHPGESENSTWEEVLADIDAGVVRAFVTADGLDPAFERIRASTSRYIRDYVVDSYKSRNGLSEEADGRKGFSQTPVPSGPNDPGANKSYRDSLFANEPAEQEQTGELPDDDMTPLNEQSKERDEERRKEQQAATKKRLGANNHNRLMSALEKLEGWAKEFTEKYGAVETDEHGGIVEDEEGNAVKDSTPQDFAKRVRSMLEGEETVQSFAEYYESLRPAEGDTNQTDANYLYDGALAETLAQLADAERELIYAENGGNKGAEKNVLYGEGPSLDVAKENYAKAAEAFARSFETRTELLQDSFDSRVKFNGEVTSHAKDEKAGLKNWLQRLSDKFWQTQMRPDTFFKMLGGFSAKSEAANDLAQRSADSLKTKTNVRNSARQFFHDLTTNPETKKAWADIESGKTKGNVDIPGLGKASMDYELAMLKTLMTNGALDHIARYGAQFVNESDYRKGYNNNGRGSTESYAAQHRLTRETLDQMARDNLAKADKKVTGKALYDEKISILKSLRSELMSDVSSNPVAKAAYDASVEAMQYLATEINGVTLRLYGLAKALQGSNYWPMQVVGRGNNLQFINNSAFTMEDASYLQHRKGGSGTLLINPFTGTMSQYIDRASQFVGFGELNSDLLMMSKEMGVGRGANDAEKQSIQSVIKKQAGENAAKWMTRYMETLNGTAKKPSGIGSKIRSNLASSSLTLNPGVALKQAPSYYNAAGIIDLDILVRNRLVNFGALRTAKSYENDLLIQELNRRTGVLESRKSGTVVLGEQDGRALFGNLKKHLPNWITSRDVSTISNLALACAEQVKRNNPDIGTKSNAFYEKTAALLEEAVVKTQPIYDAEFRPDYLRSDSEIVRMMAMFRTQQSQNLNNLMQAYGELAAAKRDGGNVKAAQKKARQVTSGYVASQVMFAMLSSAAKMLTHKTKDYEDEDGNFKWGKLAKRLGLDFLSQMGGVVWFGDTVAKLAIDAATGLYAKATGNKDAATEEFYKLSDNTVSTVDSLLASVLKVFRNPTPKNVKGAIFDAAQSTGLPARNFYNMFNAAFMYGVDAAHKNPDNYDDSVDMWQTQAGKSDSAKAKQTTHAAVGYIKRGGADRAEAMLATLDYGSNAVRQAVRQEAGDAYVRGDIDEKTYRKILKDTKQTQKEIDSAVHGKELDKVIAALTATDPKKYDALTQSIKETRDTIGEGESKSEAVARLILDAAIGKKGTAAFLEKYTSAGYFRAYEAASIGFNRSDVVDILASIDKDKDENFTQEELYNYFRETGSSSTATAIWKAEMEKSGGWKTTFNEYRAQQAKNAEYRRIQEENDNPEFGEAEKILKGLKQDATMVLQKAENDPAILKAIGGMGLNDKDTDTVVNRYASAKTRDNYRTLRDSGYSPQKVIALLAAVDADGKGTINQDEMYAYYLAHKGDEATIEKLWNAQGYTGKNSATWAAYKKHKRGK